MQWFPTLLLTMLCVSTVMGSADSFASTSCLFCCSSASVSSRSDSGIWRKPAEVMQGLGDVCGRSVARPSDALGAHLASPLQHSQALAQERGPRCNTCAARVGGGARAALQAAVCWAYLLGWLLPPWLPCAPRAPVPTATCARAGMWAPVQTDVANAFRTYLGSIKARAHVQTRIKGLLPLKHHARPEAACRTAPQQTCFHTHTHMCGRSVLSNTHLPEV